MKKSYTHAYTIPYSNLQVWAWLLILVCFHYIMIFYVLEPYHGIIKKNESNCLTHPHTDATPNIVSNLQTCSAGDASASLGNPCQNSWYLQLDFFFAYSAVWIFVAGIYNCYFIQTAREIYFMLLTMSVQNLFLFSNSPCCLGRLLLHFFSPYCPVDRDFWSLSLLQFHLIESPLSQTAFFTKWGIQPQWCVKYRPGVVCAVGSRPVQGYQCRFPHFCNKWFC